MYIQGGPQKSTHFSIFGYIKRGGLPHIYNTCTCYTYMYRLLYDCYARFEIYGVVMWYLPL